MDNILSRERERINHQVVDGSLELKKIDGHSFIKEEIDRLEKQVEIDYFTNKKLNSSYVPDIESEFSDLKLQKLRGKILMRLNRQLPRSKNIEKFCQDPVAFYMYKSKDVLKTLNEKEQLGETEYTVRTIGHSPDKLPNSYLSRRNDQDPRQKIGQNEVTSRQQFIQKPNIRMKKLIGLSSMPMTQLASPRTEGAHNSVTLSPEMRSKSINPSDI